MRRYIAFRQTPVLKAAAFEIQAINVADRHLIIFFTSQPRALILGPL
jgi:hypothetical protein